MDDFYKNKKMKLVAKNVMKFIKICSKLKADMECEKYDQQLFKECSGYKIECPMQSPIEQILYCALKTIFEINCFRNIKGNFWLVGGQVMFKGYEILPQYKIDNYRVDFLVNNYEVKRCEQTKKSIIIECDSQQFHERTEKERTYEKKRDRYLSTKEYVIFHYTGKDIIINAFDIAKEIVSYLTNTPQNEIRTQKLLKE